MRTGEPKYDTGREGTGWPMLVYVTIAVFTEQIRLDR